MEHSAFTASTHPLLGHWGGGGAATACNDPPGGGSGDPPPAGATGLFHVAILYPTRAALADALRRLLDAGVKLDGASDHGVSEALYLRDPDQNGVELYWDRPQKEWPHTPDGKLEMYTHALDLQSLLLENE